jgi:hypothetical protein
LQRRGNEVSSCLALELDVWSFSGVWSLDFEVLLDPPFDLVCGTALGIPTPTVLIDCHNHIGVDLLFYLRGEFPYAQHLSAMVAEGRA